MLIFYTAIQYWRVFQIPSNESLLGSVSEWGYHESEVLIRQTQVNRWHTPTIHLLLLDIAPSTWSIILALLFFHFPTQTIRTIAPTTCCTLATSSHIWPPCKYSFIYRYLCDFLLLHHFPSALIVASEEIRMSRSSLVSYPTRWSFSFILGHMHWSCIFLTSREPRNIVQLCTRSSPSPPSKSEDVAVTIVAVVVVSICSCLTSTSTSTSVDNSTGCPKKKTFCRSSSSRSKKGKNDISSSRWSGF